MQVTGLAVYVVMFSIVVLSIVARIYDQVKRNQSYIELLLEQRRQDIAERRRAERIKEWIENASSDQIRRRMHGA